MAVHENKVIGLKQTVKAIKQNIAKLVYVAEDANSSLTGPVVEICNKKEIDVEYVKTSRELGLLNGISVCAAVVCILK